MPVLTPDQYSRKQTVDIETALAIAARTAIDKSYPGAGGEGDIRFADIFEDWPTFESRFVDPAAVILPDGDTVYARSFLTPALLEDTWEVQGEDGLGLYQLGEAEREFEIQVRSTSAPARNAIKAGLESAFINPGVNATGASGLGNGLLVLMPEYWNLPAWLTLISSRKLDDADSAAKNIWEARFKIHAQTKHVVLQPVHPFRFKVIEQVGDEPVPT